MNIISAFTGVALVWSGLSLAQTHHPLPVADVHVHYSHDSVEMTPPERAVELMREANLKFALVSSSDDRGTQLLSELAPDLIVPALRPYTRRGQIDSWQSSEANLRYVESLLETNRYASLGEFHLYGADADLPIPRRMVELAVKHNLLLQAHSDADAVERLLAQDKTIRVIWAHAGFEDPVSIGAMLAKHDRLWADLAFRSEVGAGEQLSDDWRELFTRFPDRLMLGTDSFTPERLYFIPRHAERARQWLAELPAEVAEAIAWKNAYDLIMPVWMQNRQPAAHDHAAMKHDQKSMAAVDGLSASEVVLTGKSEQHTLVQNLVIGVECENSDAPFLIEDQGIKVSIRPLADLAVSEPVPLSLTVCGEQMADAEVTLDAAMPAHGHGINYEPSHDVVARSDMGQQLHVEGVILHMPGQWQWRVSIKNSQGQRVLTHDFVVQ